MAAKPTFTFTTTTSFVVDDVHQVTREGTTVERVSAGRAYDDKSPSVVTGWMQIELRDRKLFGTLKVGQSITLAMTAITNKE
jgi:hypothetical protein